MFTRTLTAICVAAALAVPVNAAQAGVLGNAAKIVKVGVIGNAHLAKGALKIAKTSVVGNALLAKCLVKAATSKPCI